MRTTIQLPDELLARAKRAAAESNTTLTTLIEESLRRELAQRRRPPRAQAEPPTYGEGGLQPGVDLDDSAALLALMDTSDATD